MSYTYSDELYSDIHKDAYGFRPRNGGVWDWDRMSPAEKQAAWDRMEEKIQEDIDFEKQAAERAAQEFEAEVQSYISLGAGDRETALRWIIQSEDREFFHEQCVEMMIYNRGFLFTDEGRKVVQEICKVAEFKEWQYD